MLGLLKRNQLVLVQNGNKVNRPGFATDLERYEVSLSADPKLVLPKGRSGSSSLWLTTGI